MKAIGIETNNISIINAIRAIVALDPQGTIAYDIEPNMSEKNIKDLQKLIEADKRGELKYQDFDDFKAEMRAYSKSKSISA